MTTTETFTRWITCPQPNPQAKLRLFCFPYAGGRAWNFRTWANQLPSIFEVNAIELPGRGWRLAEPLCQRLEPLVEAIASAIFPALDRPLAFFGHSMGGLIAFELARRLRQNYGLLPAHLIISGRRAPQVPNPHPPIHALPESAFLAEIRRFNGTPAEVLENADLMEILLPILRADFTVVETYRYLAESPLNCPITVLGGLEDPETNEYLLQAWQEQTTEAFSLQMLPGDHFFVHSAQSRLLELLAEALEQTIQLNALNSLKDPI